MGAGIHLVDPSMVPSTTSQLTLPANLTRCYFTILFAPCHRSPKSGSSGSGKTEMVIQALLVCSWSRGCPFGEPQVLDPPPPPRRLEYSAVDWFLSTNYRVTGGEIQPRSLSGACTIKDIPKEIILGNKMKFK